MTILPKILIFAGLLGAVVVILSIVFSKPNPKYYKCDTKGNCILDTKGTNHKNDPTCGNTCIKYCEQGKQWSTTGQTPCQDCKPESTCKDGVLSSCTPRSNTQCNPAPPSPPPPSPPSSAGNPFDNTKYDYLINPHLTNELKKLTNDDAKKGLNQAAAFWIDSIAAIKTRSADDGGSLKDYLEAAASNDGNKPVTAVFIVYNLPGRDCAAGASNGELICQAETSPEDCDAALERYKKEYIEALVELLEKYPNLNLVAVIEPDSLPNAATNMSKENCIKAVPYYKKGIEYAIKYLSTLPNITMYLDAAHGGWLGFPGNLTKYSKVACDVLSNSGSLDKVRGFSTNVSNYQPLGVDKYGSATISTDQPCTDLIVGQNNNEINFINSLYNEMKKSCNIQKDWKFITDTGRNGVTDVRKTSLQNCADWCNIKGGLGLKPSSDTQNDKIDAYFWLKTPGESDGCTKKQCKSKGFDYMCDRNAVWQFSPAPDAGVFDPNMALTLYNNRKWPN